MIENGIARFDVAQKIDEGNVVSLGAREGAHDEVEVSGSETRPTIRPDHRGVIMRDRDVHGKPDSIGLDQRIGEPAGKAVAQTTEQLPSVTKLPKRRSQLAARGSAGNFAGDGEHSANFNCGCARTFDRTVWRQLIRTFAPHFATTRISPRDCFFDNTENRRG
jgi:hypothetical protein